MPVGVEYITYAKEHAALPFVAIGGIKEHNIAQVRGAGADTVCVVSEITGAEDIAGKVKRLAELMN